MIGVLVIHHRRNTLTVKPVRRSECPHPASQDDNVRHKASFLNVGSNGEELRPALTGPLRPERRLPGLWACESCFQWPALVLLPPKLLCQPTTGRLHIIEGNYLVLRNIPPQHAIFGQADGQRAYGSGCGAIVNQTIGTKSADTIEKLPGFEVAFGNGEHFTDRPCERRHRRVLMNDRSADRRGNLHMRQVKGSVEDEKRAVTQPVVR